MDRLPLSRLAKPILRQRSTFDELVAVFKACGIAGILLVVATVFTREARYSRGMLVIFTGVFCANRTAPKAG